MGEKMKFRKKPVIIEAVQLRWDTWSEMREFAGVGKLSDGKPEGCFIGSDGNPVLESHEGYLSEEIGLRKDEEGFNAKPCFILGRKDNDGTFCRGIKNNL